MNDILKHREDIKNNILKSFKTDLEKSDFKDTAQYMFDTIENYDGDGSYMGYLYGDDEGIDKKIAKIFDIIMAGGNKNVQVKLKEFDWKENSKAKEWKEKMEKSGYKVSDLAPGGDTYVYAAFRDKKKKILTKRRHLQMT